jgi:hypothetical protein
MRPSSLLGLLALSSIGSLASVLEYLPSAQDLVKEANALLHPTNNAQIEVHHDYLDETTQSKRKLCVLHPLGGDDFDDENFKIAVKECGNGGIVRLPDAN